MDIRDIKNGAKQAAAHLKNQGIELTHSQMLEALAQAFGVRNWGVLQGVVRQATGNAPGEQATALLPTAPWSADQGPMPEDEYVARGTNQCPSCGSYNIDAKEIEADGASAWDTCTCGHCGSTWNTAYTATGYFNLQPKSDDAPIAQTAEVTRDELIQCVIDDVRSRARKYGFAVHTYSQALEVAATSAELVGLDAELTQEEIEEAARRLL